MNNSDTPIFIIPLKQPGTYNFFPKDMQTIAEFISAKRERDIAKFKRWQNEERLEIVRQNTRIIKNGKF